MNEFKYVEYRKQLIIKKPLIVEVSKIPGIGYRSMYQVNSLGKDHIEHNGLRNFKDTRLPVWSNELFVDFDHSLTEAKDLFIKLEKQQVQFKVFFSGGKGWHFHIKRDIEPSMHVPHSDKEFVKVLAPGADLKIYTHLHPFRLEGTVHEKTGYKKVLKYEKAGKPLNVELKVHEVNFHKITSEGSVFNDFEIMSLTNGINEGSRNHAMFKLAKLLLERGESLDFIEGWVRNVNVLNTPPLEEYELDNLLRGIK